MENSLDDLTSDGVAIDRRRLLVRLGGMAAAAGIAPALLRPPAARAELAAPAPGASSLASAAVAQTWPITTDTFNGIAAFVAPGDDPYSTHQGRSVPEPGGIAARAGEFGVVTLNEYFPIPEAAAFVVEALDTQLHAVPLPEDLDAFTWLDGVLEHDGTVPLGPMIAGLVNLLAVQVDPASVAGPFATPFPRLSWEDKAEVWRQLEVEVPTWFDPAASSSLLPGFSRHIPHIRTLAGVIRFAAGAALEILAFGTYNEWYVADPHTDRLTREPIGWELTEYAGPVDGWDEFIGYYQGRTTADA